MVSRPFMTTSVNCFKKLVNSMHSFSPFNNPGSFLTHEDISFPHTVHINIQYNSNHNSNHLLGRDREINFKTDILVTHMLSVNILAPFLLLQNPEIY